MGFLRFARATSWCALFYAALTLGLLRIIIGGFVIQDSTHVVYVVALIFSFVLMFLLEGLLASGTQLKTVADDSGARWIRAHVSRQHQAAALKVFEAYRGNFDKFVSGRQILIMMLVVAQVLLLERIKVSRDLAEFDFVTQYAPGLGDKFFLLLNSPIIAVAVATLVPCWLAQLLPQILAHEHAVEFSMPWLARRLVRLCILIGTIGVGWPSEHVAAIVRRIGRFTDPPERFDVGERELFERLSRSIGFFVKLRRVTFTFTDEKTAVSDTSIYSFERGETRGVEHTIHLGPTVAKNLTWDHKFPDDLKYGDPVPHAYAVIQREILPAGAIEKSTDLVLALNTKFTQRLPRGDKPEEGRFTAGYDLEKLDLGDTGPDKFHIDVSRPTERLEIEILGQPPVMVPEPSGEFLSLDGLQPLRNLHAGFPHFKHFVADDGAHGWRIVLDYPPVGSFVQLAIDGCINTGGAGARVPRQPETEARVERDGGNEASPSKPRKSRVKPASP